MCEQVGERRSGAVQRHDAVHLQLTPLDVLAVTLLLPPPSKNHRGRTVVETLVENRREEPP